MLTKLIKKSFFPLLLLLCSNAVQASYPSLARNDYFPLHSTLDPHAYLQTRIKEQMHDRTDEEPTLNHFSFSITPFMQNATIGKDYCNKDSNLGCLNARWSMIGLIMGFTPEGQTFSTSLIEAQNALFPGVSPINDPKAINPQQEFGFYDFPGDYRKRGVRFDMEVGLWGGFGLGLNGGGSDINFRICEWKNLTPETQPSCISDNTNLTKINVDKYLMCKLQDIADELGLDMTNFHKSAWEDTTLYAFWRDAFKISDDPEHGWEQFLVIPHLNVAFIAPSGEKKATNRAFGLPFGNNGHKAIGVKGGVDLDFTATIELGWELGFVHFFDHVFDNYFVPTSELQQGIFPFKTTVKVEPGFNWHFGLHMQAHHFMDKLSFYGQWVIMEHMNDKITVCNNDSAFKPAALERYTGWKAQVFNSALNYDISPHIGLGILWQAPLSQRNVFRSSTFMIGLNLIF